MSLKTDMGIQYSCTIRVDYLDYEYVGKMADIIWVIDNSPSITDDQQNIQANAALFINALDSRQVDYRLAVVGFQDTPFKSLAPGGQEWTTFGSEFGAMVVLQVSEDERENGLTAIQYALDNYTFRPEAGIFIVLVTDEDADDYSQDQLETTIDRLNGAGAVVFGVIDPRPGHVLGYLDGGVIEATGGQWQDITTADWSITLEEMATGIAAIRHGEIPTFTGVALSAEWTPVIGLPVKYINDWGELPSDLFTNHRYAVQSMWIMTSDLVIGKFSSTLDGVDIVSGKYPEVMDAYVVVRSLEPYYLVNDTREDLSKYPVFMRSPTNSFYYNASINEEGRCLYFIIELLESLLDTTTTERAELFRDIDSLTNIFLQHSVI